MASWPVPPYTPVDLRKQRATKLVAPWPARGPVAR